MGKKISAPQYKLKRHYVALGGFLREARLKADLSQRNVSVDLGYSSAQFISNFERGIAAPPVKKLCRILDMYGVSNVSAVELLLQGKAAKLRADIAAEKSLRKPRRGGKKRVAFKE